VATDEAALPREAFERSEYYNDFLKPQDIFSALWVRLELADREVTTITWGRSERRGRFDAEHLEAATALKPHLVRAYKMGRNLSGRLGLAHDLVQAVEASPHAVMVLDVTGRVIHANARASSLVGAGRGLSLVAGRLVASHADTNPALQKLIASGLRDDAGRSGGAMAIPSPLGRLPLALRTSPIPGSGMPIFGAPGGLLVTVTDLDRQLRSPADELRLLFGLTPAEARLADAIFDGLSLPEAADRFGLSLHTVRFQIARVFEKSGVARQTDLVKLMMRLAG
jgi:DNA-binding CsgD family transcriptional regulator/PAS domain-containing protein